MQLTTHSPEIITAVIGHHLIAGEILARVISQGHGKHLVGYKPTDLLAAALWIARDRWEDTSDEAISTLLDALKTELFGHRDLSPVLDDAITIITALLDPA